MKIQNLLDSRYEQFMVEQLNERKIHDAFGLRHLDDVDLEVCYYVINHLLPMNVDEINLGKKIDIYEMIDIALNQLDKIGGSVSLDAEKITYAKSFVKFDTDDCLQLTTSISYEITDDGVLENSGQVSYFLVPDNLYEISGYFFGHEQLHALKEIDYREYINQRTLGEVIPIFYEFMIYSPEEDMCKEILKVRIRSIFDNALEYKLFNDAFRANKLNEIILGEDKETIRKSKVYEYARTKMGCYLNSFYYALILYNMYKETPERVLGLVSRVLKHEITTLNMLEQLGIYGDIRGEIFEKELRNTKKLIR